MKHTTRVGLFGIGLKAYWPQFKGLKQRLEGYVRQVHERIQRPGVEVINLGLIEDHLKWRRAGREVGRSLRGSGGELFADGLGDEFRAALPPAATTMRKPPCSPAGYSNAPSTRRC